MLFLLTRRLLKESATAPRLAPPLALAAALIATLSPAWQLEATIAGGSTLAAGLALAALLLRPPSTLGDPRYFLGFGALLGATALESHAAGLAVLVALGVHVAVIGQLPSRRSTALLTVGAVTAAAVCAVPMLVRPLADRALVDLGYEIGPSLTAIDVPAERPGALALWFDEVGLVSLGLAAFGAGVGLVRRATRPLTAPFVAWVVMDLAFPASRTSLLAPDMLSPLRLLALGALASLAALGVQTLALGLIRARLPFARPVAVLLVVFELLLVLLACEDSAHVADRRSQHAAERWTDEAVSTLPHGSLLLVRSPGIAWRLWAARVARGERPDLVVVPLSLLDRGSVAAKLLELEPTLAPLIRDTSMSGRPSEFALSTLADARPLFVEFDPTWDPRLGDHLLPSPFWFAFAPHAVGRSDREAAFGRKRNAFRRALRVATAPEQRDRATLTVLAGQASEQAVTLAALGDRDTVAHVLEDLDTIDPAHPVAREIRARFERDRTGQIDIAGLLSR
jgi:hypothetical protein